MAGRKWVDGRIESGRVERVEVRGRLAELLYDYDTGCYRFVRWLEARKEAGKGEADALER